MILELTREEKPTRNRELLGLQIAGKTNDFHAIAQRFRNRLQRVGGRDEQHLRQIVVDFEIVIVERVMLLGVEDFEQRRSRIATPVAAKLVHFVKQNDRVHRFGATHRLNDATRECADVRATMATNFCFVAHTAQCHTHEFAPQRIRNGATERSLADTRRSNETEQRTGQLSNATEHRDMIENSLFDFFQSKVIAVEHTTRMFEIDGVIAARGPRKCGHPVEPPTRDGGIGRHRRATT